METSVVYRVVNTGVQTVVQHNIITTVYCPSLIPSVLSPGGLCNNTVDERPKSESDCKVGVRCPSFLSWVLSGESCAHGCIFYHEILIIPKSLGGKPLSFLGPGPK